MTFKKAHVRSWWIAGLVLFAVAVLAFAQGPRGPQGPGPGAQGVHNGPGGFGGGAGGFGGGPGMRGHHRGPDQAIQFVREFLELTDEQVEEIAGVREAYREVFEGLRSEIHLLRENLESELTSEDPDETVVGSLVLEIRSLREEVRLTSEQMSEDIRAALTQEQREKIEKVKEAAELLRAARAFRALHLIGPGPGGLGGPGPDVG